MLSDLVEKLKRSPRKRNGSVEYDYDYLRITNKQLEDLDLGDLNADESAFEAMGFQLFCIGLMDILGKGYSNEDAERTWDDLPEPSRRAYKLKVKLILMAGVFNYDQEHGEAVKEKEHDGKNSDEGDGLEGRPAKTR